MSGINIGNIRRKNVVFQCILMFLFKGDYPTFVKLSNTSTYMQRKSNEAIVISMRYSNPNNMPTICYHKDCNSKCVIRIYVREMAKALHNRVHDYIDFYNHFMKSKNIIKSVMWINKKMVSPVGDRLFNSVWTVIELGFRYQLFFKTKDQMVSFLEHIPKFSHEQTQILLNLILKHLNHHNMEYRYDIVRVLLFHTINPREITSELIIYNVCLYKVWPRYPLIPDTIIEFSKDINKEHIEYIPGLLKIYLQYVEKDIQIQNLHPNRRFGRS